MKTLPLTQGYTALVDDADYELASAHRWRAFVVRHKDGSLKNVYAVRVVVNGNGQRTTQPLHHFVLGVFRPRLDVDHINHVGIDCTRNNLRLCTRQQNAQNSRRSRANTSGHKGVTWNKRDKRWKAQISVNGNRKFLGYFLSKESAAMAYAAAAQEHFGQFACTVNENSNITLLGASQ